VFLPGLSACRGNAGLKQIELAEMVGLTPETLSRHASMHLSDAQPASRG